MCLLDVLSLLVALTYLPDAARVTVNPGTYRVRIYYGALDSVDEFRLDGDDHYRVVLWLDANKIEPKIFKMRY